MLRLDLCNYNDACIVVKGTIDVLAAAANENDKAQKSVLFKNNAPFRSPENTRKPPPPSNQIEIKLEVNHHDQQYQL